MGTTIFTTDKPREAVIAHELAPLEIVATSFGDTSAVAAVRIPLTDENTEDFRRVYDLADTDQTVTVAIVIKHEGSLNGTGRRNVSWKEMPEDMNPYYSGGATKSLLDKLTPLLPCPASANTGALPLHWAHDWRTAARAAQ
ncbi:hypothetical protein J7443_23790 [Tropicibacter sp. R15_0]|uniref:hypothetical protein n=1 Tax=Tropicibacter sp. R15_0 TaxID=2821101 RepID=UPI001ADB0030|nr:hypothetical protein [Tropicibacter sp. R15_0]MBO9468270.1 hypothetical protein [Tropicibacter sp. R15_0]